MGMDVVGKNATSKTGEYFRNNVWMWRPLWDYCVMLAPELCGDVLGGNDGDGLDTEGAEDLSAVLFNELAAGRTAEYEQAHNQMIADLPRHDCPHCDATGIRTDSVGLSMGMPTRELEPEIQILTERTHGWCNACGGEGKIDDWRAAYPFITENVRRFAEFLAECGGFSIY